MRIYDSLDISPKNLEEAQDQIIRLKELLFKSFFVFGPGVFKLKYPDGDVGSGDVKDAYEAYLQMLDVGELNEHPGEQYKNGQEDF